MTTSDNKQTDQEEKEIVDGFCSELANLKDNNKLTINLLTLMAEDYAEYASAIVDAIENALYQAPSPMKIVILYVVDSIVKNLKDLPYRRLFEKKIANMIAHVFQESPEQARGQLYKLRCTWTPEIFMKSKLLSIDMRINALDKAWPTSTRAVVSTAPATTQPSTTQNGQSSSATAVNQPSVAQQPSSAAQSTGPSKQQPPQKTTNNVVHVNPKFLDRKQPAEQSKQQTKGAERMPPPAAKQPQQPQEKRINQRDPRQQRQQQTSTTAVPAQNNNSSAAKPTSAAQPTAAKPSQPSATKPAQTSVAKPAQPSAAVKPPQRVPRQAPPGSRSPPPVKRFRKTPEQLQQQQQAATFKPPFIQQPKQEPRGSPPHAQGIQRILAPEPTATPGTHAFARLPLPPAQKVVPTPTFPPPQRFTGPGPLPPMMSMPPPGVVPVPISVGEPQRRHIKDEVMEEVPRFQPPVSVPPPFFPPVSMPSGFPSMSMPPPGVVPMSVGDVPPHQLVHHHIKDETPRFQGVPENKKIFLDGKAYEVFYLEDVAVIERNGLPHRVSFTGPPRDVIVDGHAYKMEFGRTQDVLIDGQKHTLRFGAPSRELYMGAFPFKGAFGGPPIVATINGRRHEIRLCGPPPEVKIDPEPSHELARYMPALYPTQQQMQQQQAPRQEPKKESQQEVQDLLKKLKQSGFLNPEQKRREEEAKRLAAAQASTSAVVRRQLSPPPIACDNRILNNIQRSDKPMSALEQFSMRALIIRYDSIIDKLHRPRIVCQYCGIAFKELYGEAYQRHADWHLQDKLLKDNKYNRSNPWYMLEDWFTYSETETVNRPQTAEGDKNGAADGAIAGEGDSNNKDVASSATEERECHHCKEKFEEYHDDDDDEWKLKDSALKEGKAYHRMCLEELDVEMT